MSRRTIKPTNRFRSDWERETAGKSKKKVAELESLLGDIVESLADDAPIDAKYRDHALTGNWKGSRDLHVKSDLVLIYEKTLVEIEPVLLLLRIGSHSELGL
jgi:mRNA interferase YafQ